MKNQFRNLWLLIRDSAVAWDEDNVWRLGAALAFFTAFSLAPLLTIVIALGSFGFGEEAARGHLFFEIRGLIGNEGALFVQRMLENAHTSGSGTLAALFGVLMLIGGSTAVFVQLRQSLNTIWKVKQKPVNTIRGFLVFLRARLLSFAMILAIGFLLIVSLIMSALLAALSEYLGSFMPLFGELIPVFDFLVSFVGIAFLIALIFRFLSDARTSWKDVLLGGAVTSLLFSGGKIAIGFYLGQSAIGSTFGAANSLVIVLLWAFYSSQILFLGAEFTRVYATRFGSGISAGAGAVHFDIREEGGEWQSEEEPRVAATDAP